MSPISALFGVRRIADADQTYLLPKCLVIGVLYSNSTVISKCIKACVEGGLREPLIVMGLLSLGTPLHWDQAKHYADHVRYHGITQFLNIWDRLKDRQGDELLWGDEVLLGLSSSASPQPLISRSLQVEYMIVQLDTDAKDAVLSLCQTDILDKLQALSNEIDAKTGST